MLPAQLNWQQHSKPETLSQDLTLSILRNVMSDRRSDAIIIVNEKKCLEFGNPYSKHREVREVAKTFRNVSVKK